VEDDSNNLSKLRPSTYARTCWVQIKKLSSVSFRERDVGKVWSWEEGEEEDEGVSLSEAGEDEEDMIRFKKKMNLLLIQCKMKKMSKGETVKVNIIQ